MCVGGGGEVNQIHSLDETALEADITEIVQCLDFHRVWNEIKYRRGGRVERVGVTGVECLGGRWDGTLSGVQIG